MSVGMRAGAAASKIYEEYRKNMPKPDKVVEITYDTVIVKMYCIIIWCLVLFSPVMLWLAWDTINNGADGSMFMLYEFTFFYVVVTIGSILQYIKMKKWRMVCTETSVIRYSAFGKREVSLQELRVAAKTKPVVQRRNHFRFATKGAVFKIPLLDMVPFSPEFCAQVAIQAQIALPKIKRREKRNNLQACAIITALLPIVFVNLYFYRQDDKDAIMLLLFAAALGAIALGFFIWSLLVKE